MSAARWMIAAFLFLVAGLSSAHAECIPMREARAMIQTGKIMALGAALRTARQAARGEMIDGRLCRRSGGLHYVVTFLGPDGRVMRVSIDARSGAVVGVR